LAKVETSFFLALLPRPKNDVLVLLLLSSTSMRQSSFRRTAFDIGVLLAVLFAVQVKVENEEAPVTLDLKGAIRTHLQLDLIRIRWLQMCTCSCASFFPVSFSLERVERCA
jgi:hypothetical protein